MQLLSPEVKTQFECDFAAIDREVAKPLKRSDRSLETTLNNIFPSQKEETKLQKAKRILGDSIKGLPDHELEAYIAGFQYLLDCWLDEYERLIFNDKTLMELLKEG
jgi:hypothetical protein